MLKLKLNKRKSIMSTLCITGLLCISLSVTALASINNGSSGSTDESSYSALTESIGNKVNENTYQTKDGGYVAGKTMYDSKTGKVNDSFDNLTTSSKQQMLKDMNDAADSKIQQDAENSVGNKTAVSENTKNNWLQQLQNCPGVGGQLMTNLFGKTKPDYVKAAKIYAPFQGPISTALGVLAIVVSAGVCLTMGVDLCYMGIPMFRNFLNSGGESEATDRKSKVKFVSFEAVNAVNTAESDNKDGTFKCAMWIYFKHRAVALFCLGLCLLYLISGEIFSLIGVILDLLHGFTN